MWSIIRVVVTIAMLAVRLRRVNAKAQAGRRLSV